MARGRLRSSTVAGRRSAKSSNVSSAVSSVVPSRACSPGPPVQPFRFFDLPLELRLKVYESLLVMPKPLDLDPTNYFMLHPRLAVFLVSRRMHDEAYRVFYSQPMRIFPLDDRFFCTKQPLLARLPARYRRVVTTMSLCLGRGWTAPPACQNTHSSLGLYDCINLRTLKIFVELDPSDNIFLGFRGKNATEDTYKWFCVDLLLGILEQVPSLETVEIDAYPSIKREGPLVLALKRTVEERKVRLVWGPLWGPLRGWEKEGDEPGLIGVESAMADMRISDGPGRLVEVQA